jgi:hypothetical protein
LGQGGEFLTDNVDPALVYERSTYFKKENKHSDILNRKFE